MWPICIPQFEAIKLRQAPLIRSMMIHLASRLNGLSLTANTAVLISPFFPMPVLEITRLKGCALENSARKAAILLIWALASLILIPRPILLRRHIRRAWTDKPVTPYLLHLALRETISAKFARENNLAYDVPKSLFQRAKCDFQCPHGNARTWR